MSRWANKALFITAVSRKASPNQQQKTMSGPSPQPRTGIWSYSSEIELSEIFWLEFSVVHVLLAHRRCEKFLFEILKRFWLASLSDCSPSGTKQTSHWRRMFPRFWSFDVKINRCSWVTFLKIHWLQKVEGFTLDPPSTHRRDVMFMWRIEPDPCWCSACQQRQPELQQGGGACAAATAGETQRRGGGSRAQRRRPGQPPHPAGHGSQEPQPPLSWLAGMGLKRCLFFNDLECGFILLHTDTSEWTRVYSCTVPVQWYFDVYYSHIQQECKSSRNSHVYFKIIKTPPPFPYFVDANFCTLLLSVFVSFTLSFMVFFLFVAPLKLDYKCFVLFCFFFWRPLIYFTCRPIYLLSVEKCLMLRKWSRLP